MPIQTDQQLMGEIQDHLLEPYDAGLTWPSGLWTQAEVVQALFDAQNEFRRDSGCLLDTATLPVLASTHRVTLPGNWILTEDVTWRDVLGLVVEVPRSDDVEADNALPDWEVNTAPTPLLYTDASQPTLQIQLMPAPSLAGQLEILYVALGPVLTGLGVPLGAPDFCTPAIKWRAIGILLEKLGRASDFEGATYCRMRYQEGIAGIQAVLRSWGAI